MNKVIYELTKQAGLMHAMKHTGVDLDIEIEKFAELLIKECAAIADETGCGDPTYGWMVGNRITEHFGIE